MGWLSVVYSHTNTNGNIIKHNLRTNTLLYEKIYLSHLFPKGLMFLWCVRDVSRDIYSEREDFFFPYLLPGARGCQRLHSLCKLVRDASAQLHVPRSSAILCLCLKLTTWVSSRDLLLVIHLLYPSALIAPSSSCLLIKMWQLTKAHGVTWNERKIHVRCDITFVVFVIWLFGFSYYFINSFFYSWPEL